jgi:hypothetical protein
MTETHTLPQLQRAASHVASDVTFSDVTMSGAGPTKRPSPKRRRTNGATILVLSIAIVANLAIIALIASRADSTPAITARPRVPTPPSPAAPAPPEALSPAVATTTFGEGKFVVGTDIAPGTYWTTGKSGHHDCYWERLKDTNGTTASIIANNLTPGPATVTIDKTDGAFQTRWCNTWTKVS